MAVFVVEKIVPDFSTVLRVAKVVRFSGTPRAEIERNIRFIEPVITVFKVNKEAKSITKTYNRTTLYGWMITNWIVYTSECISF